MAEEKDVFYKIVEMRDGIKDGIDSIDKTLKGQDELIEFLKTEPENKFKDLIIDLISQNEKMKTQKDEMQVKLEKINSVVEKCESDESAKEFVNDILYTFVRF